MKIGELAKRSGLAPSRIRFYESSGLIAAQRQANGYRDYPEQVVQTLDIVASAQQAGFSLEEIRSMLPDAGQRGWSHESLLASLQRKVGEIETMQERLAQNRMKLLAVIDSLNNRPEGVACTENAEQVLAQIRGRNV